MTLLLVSSSASTFDPRAHLEEKQGKKVNVSGQDARGHENAVGGPTNPVKMTNKLVPK